MSQLKLEMLRYRGLRALQEDGDPIAWWQDHRSTFPLLLDLAVRVLCVPALSATSERLFSEAGLTLTENRARLKGFNIPQRVTLRGLIASGVLDEY